MLVQHVEAALDRKEILVARLKAMNDVAETGRHIDSNGQLLPSFEREYAQAILDLRNVSIHACMHWHLHATAGQRGTPTVLVASQLTFRTWQNGAFALPASACSGNQMLLISCLNC